MVPWACTMKEVEQTQGYRISFEMTKPNQSHKALLVSWRWSSTLSTQALIWRLGVTSVVFEKKQLPWWESGVTSYSKNWKRENCRRASLNAQHVEAWSRCQLRTGIWGYNLHRLTKIGQTKIRKHCLVLISAVTFR